MSKIWDRTNISQLIFTRRNSNTSFSFLECEWLENSNLWHNSNTSNLLVDWHLHFLFSQDFYNLTEAWSKFLKWKKLFLLLCRYSIWFVKIEDCFVNNSCYLRSWEESGFSSPHHFNFSYWLLNFSTHFNSFILHFFQVIASIFCFSFLTFDPTKFLHNILTRTLMITFNNFFFLFISVHRFLISMTFLRRPTQTFAIFILFSFNYWFFFSVSTSPVFRQRIKTFIFRITL